MSTNLHIDYFGNLILRDGKFGLFVSSQYAAPPHYGGGRVGALCLYAVEQVNHYYPYGPRSNKEGLIILRELRACLARSAGEQVDPLGEGGIIAGISTGQDKQAFKFEDKELDRTYGLDWYDIQARQYDALAPIWNAPNPLAEKYYRFSPYNFCGGNPVNYGDYMEWYREFQNNTGPEIRLITNQSNPYIIDLKKEDTVIETQKEAIEKKGMATGYSGQWMLWHHITKGITKPILNFIESHFVDSYSLHNINMSSLSIVYDRKSRYSFAGHMDVKNPSRSNSFGFGNTYQFYFLLNK